MSQYIRMKMTAQKSIVLKRNFKNFMFTLLPIVKKMISNQINQIKSRIMRKIWPNKIRNTPKRGIKSLENNATKNINIYNTPKIVIKKRLIAVKPEIATKPK